MRREEYIEDIRTQKNLRAELRNNKIMDFFVYLSNTRVAEKIINYLNNVYSFIYQIQDKKRGMRKGKMQKNRRLF